LVSAVLVALNACGGGSSSAVPASPSKTGSGVAALSVFVPSASSSVRRRDTLPSTTESVVIAISTATGAGTVIAPTIANVGPSAPGCTPESGGISCTVDVTVPFGTFMFAVVGFTGQNGSGNAIAWGETVATVAAGTSNAINVAMSSVTEYVTMNLDGDFSVATIDHVADVLNVTNLATNTSITASVATLPNGDYKLVVTASTDSGTSVGTVVYARELPGEALEYYSTGTSAPPVTGVTSSAGDWGVGAPFSACPAQAESVPLSLVMVEGPQYATNLNGYPAFQTGTATISVSAGSASLAFSGSNYQIGGTEVGTGSGSTGACNAGVFAASSSTGEVAFSPGGVVAAGSTSSNQFSSPNNGAIGFPSATANIAAVTSGTYDGFIGGYNLQGSTAPKEGAPVNAAPAGANALLSCNYANFEAGTVATTNCATITFGTQPIPGIVLATVTAPGASIPAVFAVSQLNGKYVLFGVEGSVNVALMQH
jgi:hypothetical protein